MVKIVMLVMIKALVVFTKVIVCLTAGNGETVEVA